MRAGGLTLSPDADQQRNFIESGIIEKNHTGKSLKIYGIVDGRTSFIGFVSVRAVKRLLRGETETAIISKCSETPITAKEPLNFSIKLADPEKLESLEGV
jgi:hypothetical protein